MAVKTVIEESKIDQFIKIDNRTHRVSFITLLCVKLKQ